MPFFDYSCSNCGFVYERMRPMKSHDSEIVCPKCGAERCAMRMVSIPGRAKVPGGTGASKKAW